MACNLLCIIYKMHAVKGNLFLTLHFLSTFKYIYIYIYIFYFFSFFSFLFEFSFVERVIIYIVILF
ncbi:MAG: hypothetical protein MCS20_01560 [Candidatus Phytoplasma mali]|nr:hypothetical protein [Candidatus Phytoplasma australiense]MCG7202081.1 hypothetical protein [Candidatus Phytoplasma mali]